MNINHGDKLGEHLYFCMYPITLSNVDALLKLANAAGGSSPVLKLFQHTAEGLELTEEQAALKFNQLGLEVDSLNKYSSGGATALIEFLKLSTRW